MSTIFSTASVGKYSDKFDFKNDNMGKTKNYESTIKKYGIKTTSKDKDGIERMLNGKRGTLTYDMDGDGTLDTVDTATAMAESFDSVLDLYIQKEVQKAIKKFGHNTNGSGFLAEDGLAYLKSKNITVNNVENSDLKNRVWSFSLTDGNGNILQDENGNLGSCIFGDVLNADGYINKAEEDFPLIFDEMGFECISRADFNGTDEEYDAMINEIEAGIMSGEYSSSDQSVLSVYGKVELTHRGGGSSSTKENADALEKQKQKEEEENKSSVDNELQKLYNEELESRIKSYMSEKDKDSISETELSAIQSKLNSYILGNYDYSLEDIKKAQAEANVTVKEDSRDIETQTTSTPQNIEVEEEKQEEQLV